MIRSWSLYLVVLFAGVLNAQTIPLPSAPCGPCAPPYRPGGAPPGLPSMPGAPSTPGTPTGPGTPTPPGESPSPGMPGSTPDAPATPAGEGASGVGTGGGEGGSGSLTSGAPNMVGDLLGAGRSVSFLINRDRGPVFVEAIGATNIVNPKVADDNSPLPQDRVGFRFNYFHNAVSITGLSSETILAPERSLNGFIRPTQTKDYDYNLYTFNFEKTFLSGQASAEVRLPIRTTLSSRLGYSVGTIQGQGRLRDVNGLPTYFNPNAPPGTNPFRVFPNIPNVAQSDQIARSLGFTPLRALNVNPTPEDTLGRTETELDNVSVILKALLWRDQTLAVSGGLGVTAPTGRDTDITVTDFLGTTANINGTVIGFPSVDTMRVREFKVSRGTWGLAPFVAALYAEPDSRFFAQGFLQVDVPVGSDRVRYTETTPVALNPVIPVTRSPNDPRTNVLIPPFSANGSLRDQTLMHMDIGTGYWLLRDRSRTWLNGIVPTVELHYTTTLNNAALVNLPNDPSSIATPTGLRSPAGQNAQAPVVTEVFPGSPTVGNTRNRLDIVNLTVGTTFVIANQATVATAVALPLRGGDNRTFDWEFQLQLNWYFGGRNASLMPNLFR
jgi:hypothetical protein